MTKARWYFAAWLCFMAMFASFAVGFAVGFDGPYTSYRFFGMLAAAATFVVAAVICVENAES